MVWINDLENSYSSFSVNSLNKWFKYSHTFFSINGLKKSYSSSSINGLKNSYSFFSINSVNKWFKKQLQFFLNKCSVSSGDGRRPQHQRRVATRGAKSVHGDPAHSQRGDQRRWDEVFFQFFNTAFLFIFIYFNTTFFLIFIYSYLCINIFLFLFIFIYIYIIYIYSYNSLSKVLHTWK